MSLTNLLISLFWIFLIPLTVIMLSLINFFIRRRKDDKKINKPFDDSVKVIYEENFPSYETPQFYFIVVPEDFFGRNAHSIASFIVQVLPKDISEFQTIVVDNINDEKEIKEKSIDFLMEEAIPPDIVLKLPENWVGYISWWLIKNNPPKKYEKIIVGKEPQIDMNTKKLLEIVTDPEKIKSYLDETYVSTRTWEGFNFLRDVVFKLAKTKAGRETFEFIGKTILSKKLKIIQILKEIKVSIYLETIKAKKYVLAFNKREEAITILKDLITKLEDIESYINEQDKFAAIIKKSSSS